MQFLVQVSSRRDGQRSDELFKFYGAVLWTRVKQLSLHETLSPPPQKKISVAFGALLKCAFHARSLPKNVLYRESAVTRNTKVAFEDCNVEGLFMEKLK